MAYPSLFKLCEAGEEEFLEIMALVGMASKPLHVRRLQKALQDWVQNPGRIADRREIIEVVVPRFGDFCYTALAYHFCLALPAAFTQPGNLLYAKLSTFIDTMIGYSCSE